MQKINIVCVGNIKEKYFIDAISEYTKRISRFASISIIEVEECLSSSKTSIEQIKITECERLKKHLEGYCVAMDKGGRELDSEGLATLIDSKFAAGAKVITFIIGGSNGLTKEFVSGCDMVLSFGKITYPHQLMRVVLTEQIYRAETILNHITYHK